MWRRLFFQSVLLTVLALSAPAAFAQDADEPDPIKWTIRAPTEKPANASRITLELQAVIERGWHLYATEKVEGGPSPTRISLVSGQSFEIAGEIDSPAPRSAYDPNFQVTTEFYEGEVTFSIPVKSSTSTSADKVRVQVRYQTCTPAICLPPKLLELEALLTGAEAKANSVTNDKSTNSNAGANGATVADFDFTDFAGKSRHFSDFRGQVVLLDFWASWCSPCLADIPQLKNAYQKYHAQGFEIVGMDSETLGQKDVDAEFAKEAQIKAREIVSAHGVVWTQATAETSVPIATGKFGIESLPSKILINRQGQIVARIKDVADLDKMLPALLKPAN